MIRAFSPGQGCSGGKKGRCCRKQQRPSVWLDAVKAAGIQAEGRDFAAFFFMLICGFPSSSRSSASICCVSSFCRS